MKNSNCNDEGISSETIFSECEEGEGGYANLTDATRKITYGYGRETDDDLETGWYRYTGAAGTQILSSCPPSQKYDNNS